MVLTDPNTSSFGNRALKDGEKKTKKYQKNNKSKG
jgi:hypothetical protein